MWKHMLWYVKGDKKAGIKDVRDHIQSRRNPESKMIHQWAQSREEAEYLIENLTLSKDALVCDPFLGSGEFAIAAVMSGRRFVGVEINKETFENAKNYIISETQTE
jgi:DNA modification methylase